jgi:uncharacterized protein (DUF1501 family)
MTTRRNFLSQVAGAGIVSLGAFPPEFLCRAARAAEDQGRGPGGRVLVLVELAGGNDGLNTVVPHGDDAYYRARPGIGIPRESVLKIDEYHGLHPQLAGLKELYDYGALAIVQGVGYPNPDRSHFQSMDIWHSARPTGSGNDGGWLGRALDRAAARDAAGTPALALGVERLPLALTASKVNVPAVADLSSYRLQFGQVPAWLAADRKQALLELTRGDGHAGGPMGSDLDYIRQTARTAYTSAERVQEVAGSYRPAVNYPANRLGEQLKLIAQLIAGELETYIFFVSLGGFDTHSQQAGAHQALLEELGSALGAFYGDLRGHGLAERVVVATFSEFGRRVKENGSLGTDHGAASQMFVVTPDRGGMYGQHPSLSDLDDGDLKFHSDFRSVYATLLEKWLGLESKPVLGGEFRLLDIVG